MGARAEALARQCQEKQSAWRRREHQLMNSLRLEQDKLKMSQTSLFETQAALKASDTKLALARITQNFNLSVSSTFQ